MTHDLSQESADQERSLLVFHLGAQAYAIPIEDVVQIIPMLKLTPVPQLEHVIEGVANIHGKFVPVIRARSRLGMESIPLDLYTPIILAMAGDRQVGLIVDEVADVVRLPARQITSPDAILPKDLDRAMILSGIVYQGNEAILVLDTRYLVRPSQVRAVSQLIQDMPVRSRPTEAELFSQLVRAQPPQPCPEEVVPSEKAAPSQASLPANNGNGGVHVAPTYAAPVAAQPVQPTETPAPAEVKAPVAAVPAAASEPAASEPAALEPAGKAEPKPGKKRSSAKAKPAQANPADAENSDGNGSGSSRGLRKSFKKAISAQLAELAVDLPPVEGAPSNGTPSNGTPSNGTPSNGTPLNGGVKPVDQAPDAADTTEGTH